MATSFQLLPLCVALVACSAGTFPPSDAGTSKDSSTPNDSSTTNDGGIVSGTFELKWTIESASVANACASHSAATLKLVVAGNGAAGTTYFAPCTDFGKTIDLAPGMYDVQASLLDGQNTPRTTTAAFVITIYGTKTTSEAVDFPTSSFY